jgi:hypothetical protein
MRANQWICSKLSIDVFESVFITADLVQSCLRGGGGYWRMFVTFSQDVSAVRAPQEEEGTDGKERVIEGQRVFCRRHSHTPNQV